jgi:hypothetical protein
MNTDLPSKRYEQHYDRVASIAEHQCDDYGWGSQQQ